jgi:hypothetical protein
MNRHLQLLVKKKQKIQKRIRILNDFYLKFLINILFKKILNIKLLLFIQYIFLELYITFSYAFYFII